LNQLICEDGNVIKKLESAVSRYIAKAEPALPRYYTFTEFSRLEGMNYWSTWVQLITEEWWGIHVYDDGRIVRVA